MIESSQNKSVKAWKKLKSKKGRDLQKLFLLEGDHLVYEALAKLDARDIEQIILNAELKDKHSDLPTDKLTLVTPAIVSDLADTESSQGIFAVVKKKEAKLPQHIDQPFLFLDAIQDPGNLGTMIRTAAGAGFSAVVCGQGTVDPYNMKVLRASQGMHFNLSIYEGELKGWIEHFQDMDLPVFGTALDSSAQSYKTIQSSKTPFALILGNEGQGVNAELLEETDLNLYIPLAQQVDSLNVSVAAGILVFHLYDNY